MSNMVTLTIDDQQISVPAGTVVVDAAKKAGIDIPVFCYHPKMEPVGMCRMCLVEIGRPVRDRATGELVREEDGSLKIQFGPKLETGCTVPVIEGMVVRTQTERVTHAHKDVVEFLLTSHPLDCPICDKGGECTLQDLTMQHGAAQSRFLFDEKLRLQKHVPLGDLIFLDQERCIQCARCIRFQDEVVGDAVLEFHNRGRHTEIITNSEPGFDSYFSGNTTDICPVGALTTTDFRFGARPWEMHTVASLCTHCPVGCNTGLSVRREAKSGGDFVVKRVLPRQNEWVNETWICDKGRFGYHFIESRERLTHPLVRKNGELVEASWQEALDLVAEKFKAAGKGLFTLAGGRLSNEDLFNLGALSDGLGGHKALYSDVSGGELTTQLGLGTGSNLADLGSGDTVMVVASQLDEEAPLWFLRVKQAAQRGATLIVASARPTKLDRYATHILRYRFSEELKTVLSLLLEKNEPARALQTEGNLVVFCGHEGLSMQTSADLTQACANVLLRTGHVGRANNGLVVVWPRANDQGAYELGYRPEHDLAATLEKSSVVFLAAVDPAGDFASLASRLAQVDFLVVQELFLTASAKMADVVLPAQAFSEREGTFTNGERRVQRFYNALSPRPATRADFEIAAQLGERLNIPLAKSAEQVMAQIAQSVPAFAGMTYAALAEAAEQWPPVGNEDSYYGGTTIRNTQGVGVALSSAAERGETLDEKHVLIPELLRLDGLMAVPITRLYDLGKTLSYSQVLQPRLPHRPFIVLHPDFANAMDYQDAQVVDAELNDVMVEAVVCLDANIEPNIALVPRSMGFPIDGPAVLTVHVKKTDQTPA